MLLAGLPGDPPDHVAQGLDFTLPVADQVGNKAGPAGLVNAPIAAPLSPWKYPLKIRLPCHAGSVHELGLVKADIAAHREAAGERPRRRRKAREACGRLRGLSLMR
jgi:hypothetical protein